MKRILFVCTGNTCRSPMAEALCNQLCAKAGLPVEVKSAGIMAFDGVKPSDHACEVLKEKGIEFDGTAQSVQEQLIQWADLIFTMTQGHKHFLIQQYPTFFDKVYTLREYTHYGRKGNEKLLQRLDQIHAEIECKKVELKEDPDALNQTLVSLQEEEQNVRKQLLEHSSDYDIQDPFGGTLEEYQACAGELEQEIQKLIEIWTAERDDQS